MKLLDVGEMAPDFDAPVQDGSHLRLRDLRGRWVVLYFYPKDRTYGCTREACGFRDDHAELRAEGAEVVGVSRDDAGSHADFARRHELGFPLVADPDSKILEAYRALAWYGWARRVTYLIDPAGRIAKAYAHVNPLDHSRRVVADLRALKQESNKPVPIGTARSP
ncbi:MAG: peroxiredoxin [Euryarchaeota archaeon]|nr:peroxiredoxin [Euryarchaeota archaeon]